MDQFDLFNHLRQHLARTAEHCTPPNGPLAFREKPKTPTAIALWHVALWQPSAQLHRQACPSWLLRSGRCAKSVFRRVRGGWHGLKNVDSIRQSQSIRQDPYLTNCPIRRFRIPELGYPQHGHRMGGGGLLPAAAAGGADSAGRKAAWRAAPPAA